VPHPSANAGGCVDRLLLSVSHKLEETSRGRCPAACGVRRRHGKRLFRHERSFTCSPSESERPSMRAPSCCVNETYWCVNMSRSATST
jgi:hypothetical protein